MKTQTPDKNSGNLQRVNCLRRLFLAFAFVSLNGETRWGISTDLPGAAGYDGDGRADIAVFRPETGS